MNKKVIRPLGLKSPWAYGITAVIFVGGIVAFAEGIIPAGEGRSQPLAKAKLLIELPEQYNTPDGMCLLPDGNVILSVPNINSREYPPVLLKITPNDQIEEFYKCPPHPETGEAYPFGVACDEEGDLFLTDLQWFANPDEPNYKSRIIWIPVEDGKPGEPVTIAEGMVVANAVVVHDGYLYVSDTTMMPGTEPLVSGVYRFELDEIKRNPVRLDKPLDKSPYVIALIQTHNKDVQFGADGLTFDSKGNLYIGNFADGTIHRVGFDDQGNPSEPAIFSQAPFMKSCDGLYCDLTSDTIYVADSLANAVQIVSPDGTVMTLSVDPDNDGSGGHLDQPCEVLLRGNKLIVANFDMPISGGVNRAFNKPHTISYIDLP